ncbi:MAG TPA: YfdX family protein [Armatimonadota bacterium]|nr:YfdX family protein [Armatimonadota bacterium]
MVRKRVPIVALLVVISLAVLAGCQRISDRLASGDEPSTPSAPVMESTRPPVDLEAEPPSAPPEAETGEKTSADEAGATQGTTGAGESTKGAADASSQPAEEAKSPEALSQAAKGSGKTAPAGASAGSRTTASGPSERDQLLAQLRSDLTIALNQVEEADRQISQGKTEEAAVRVTRAQTALSFVVSEFPALVARQNCDRAMARVNAGDAQGAKSAIQRAVQLAGDIELKGTLRSFQAHAQSASSMIESGQGSQAIQELIAMAQAIAPVEAQKGLDRVAEHLHGAASALARGVPDVSAAELKGARARLWELLEALNG